ncbi:MAG: DUF1566 domain-containing protein [Alphaproteobacteria bacterium]|nr:DUF1566 domain-containing protein [Alphaproteobacteria bacterium]
MFSGPMTSVVQKAKKFLASKLLGRVVDPFVIAKRPQGDVTIPSSSSRGAQRRGDPVPKFQAGGLDCFVDQGLLAMTRLGSSFKFWSYWTPHQRRGDDVFLSRSIRSLAMTMLFISLATPTLAQTTPTLRETQIGQACATYAHSTDFDTIAQCSDAVSGTFQKAPLFIGTLTSPPYADILCDANKAGMLQWTGTTFQGCDGTSWFGMGGAKALDDLTDAKTEYTSLYNMFLGSGAGTMVTTGGYNTSLGYQTLYMTTTGVHNTAIGTNTLAVNTVGSWNSALGASALALNNTGTANTAVGAAAALNNGTGSNNTAIGFRTLVTATAGTNNSAFGSSALYNATGNNNTAVGSGVGSTTLTTGSSNILIGTSAAVDTPLASTSNFLNIGNAIKLDMTNITASGPILHMPGLANDSIGVGLSALRSMTAAGLNSAVGYMALASNISGGGSNTAMGYIALASNTTGDENTAIGSQALSSAVRSQGNTAVGASALRATATANYNTAVGFYALSQNILGAYNTSIGAESLNGTTSGTANVAIGRWALYQMSTGQANTAVGSYAGVNTGTVGGGSSYNTLVGVYSMSGAQGSSSYNVVLGYKSGNTLDAGQRNVIVGSEVASTTLTTGSSNILIGTSSAVDTPAADTSNWLNIGNTIYGDLSTGSVAIGAAAVTAGTTLDMSARTDSMIPPKGDDTTRPASPVAGMIRYSTTNNALEVYQGSTPAWVSLGASAGGSNYLGTAAATTAPSRSDDVTTGLFSDTASTVKVAVGGIEQMAVTSTSVTSALAVNIASTSGYYSISEQKVLSTPRAGLGDNLALGYGAISGEGGYLNTALGMNSMQNVSSGMRNTAVGNSSMSAVTGGNYNAAVGLMSLSMVGSGSYNTAIGSSALGTLGFMAGVGNGNTALGYSAGYGVQGGTNNTFIGNGVGQTGLTTGSANILIGTSSLVTTPATSTSNYLNIGNAIKLNMTNITASGPILHMPALDNASIGVGLGALKNQTGTSSANTALGAAALNKLTSGNFNVAVGASALTNTTTGGANTAVGWLAMPVTTTGSNNTAIGQVALYSNTNGSANVAVGRGASLFSTGENYNHNTVVGVDAGTNSNGANNVILGYQVGYNANTGSSNILIGTSSAVETPAADTSNWLNIGNTIYGDLSLGAVAIGAAAITSGSSLDLSARTDSMIPPKGDDTTRPASPVAGMIRYSTTNNALEVYQGSTPAWTALGASGTGTLAATLGTAVGSPSPYRTAEATTGLYSDESGVVQTGILGVEHLRVTATGTTTTGAINIAAITDYYAIAGTKILHQPVSDTTSIGVGPSTLVSQSTTGRFNFAAGYYSLNSSTTTGATSGNKNNAIGYYAMNSIAVSGFGGGSDNNAIGDYAYSSVVVDGSSVGSNNNAVGRFALSSVTASGYQTASYNNAIGVVAMTSLSASGDYAGSYNNAIGGSALRYNRGIGDGTGSYNNAIGFQALYNNNGGSGNTVIGSYALGKTTATYTGSRNVAVGYGVGSTTLVSGSSNILIGTSSLVDTPAAATSNYLNIGRAIKLNLTNVTATSSMLNNGADGLDDTSIGVGFGTLARQSGTNMQNTAVGRSALNRTTAGNFNTAVGYSALLYTTTGIANTAIGHSSLTENTTGSYNTALGVSALRNLGMLVAGSNYNTGIGHGSISQLFLGTQNTSLGDLAGSSLTSASNNTIIGASVASTTLATGSSNILIGTSSAVDTPAADTSNWLNIGNTIYGDLSLGAVAIGAPAITSGSSLDISARTDSVILPKGTNAQQPIGVAGMIRYNTDSQAVEVYQGTSWLSLGMTSTAGSTQYLGADATHTSPSRSDDITTGLFSDTASTVKVAISGTEKLAVTATGVNLTQVTDGYAIAGVNMLHHVGTDNTSVGIGPQSLASMTGTGAYNYAFGSGALQTNTASGTNAGWGNNAIGTWALNSNIANGIDAGSSNNVIGTGALNANIANGERAGTGNNAIGSEALNANTASGEGAGSGNNAIGTWALNSNIANGIDAGSRNNVIGTGAMSQNIANGDYAGGSNNTIGNEALQYNAASGEYAGSENNVIGNGALHNNIARGWGSGSLNNAIGPQALQYNTASGESSGSLNNAIGAFALERNTASGLNAGSLNNAIGYGALSSNAGNGDGEGSYNNAMGFSALAFNEGKGNTVLGSYAMTRLDVDGFASGPNHTGSYNVALGYGVGGSTLVSGSSNILIGTSSAVTTPAADTSNWLNIGNTIYGDLSLGAVAIGAPAITSGSSLDLSARTDSMIPPKGDDTTRPASPVAGMIRYSTTNNALEVYQGSTPAWVSLGASTGGSNYLGTAAATTAPSRSDDITTGLFSDTASTVKVAISGTEKLAVTATGVNLIQLTDGIAVAGTRVLYTPNTSSIAIGQNSMGGTATGSQNLAIGNRALYTNNVYTAGSGALNIAIGNEALFNNTASGVTLVGGGNIAIGQTAMQTNSGVGSWFTSGMNVAIGVNSLQTNIATGSTAGSNNIALGGAMTMNESNGDYAGSYNVALGGGALKYNKGVGIEAGSYNNAIGTSALYANTGSGNIAIGSYALGNSATLTGSRNVALGYSVGVTGLTTGSSNILIGTSSLVTTPATSTSNYLNIGNAIKLNMTNITASGPILHMPALDNTSIGVGLGALKNQTGTSLENTAIGYQALNFNVTGGGSTAVGYRALYSSTGGRNTAIGDSALSAATTGSANVGVGYTTLQNTTTGSRNVAVGEGALRYNIVGGSNVAIGYNVLFTSGLMAGGGAFGNTVIGTNAGTSIGVNATANYNTIVGHEVGASIVSGSSNILIGTSSAVTTPAADTSNWLNIGNTIYGDLSLGAVAIGAPAITSGSSLDLSARTDSMIPPKGDDTTRPASPVAGMIRYSTTNNALEVYQGSTPAWVSLGASTGGSNYLGTAAATTAPSRSDDVTTGLFSDTASTVSIATSGVERLRVTATGSIGIGMLDPDQMLSVNGNVNVRYTATSSGYYLSGYKILSLPFDDSDSVALGRDALQNQNQSTWGNIAIGSGAMNTNTTDTGSSAVGTYNNVVGFQALYLNTATNTSAGSYNNIMGYWAARSNIVDGSNAGTGNNVIGYRAFRSNTGVGTSAASWNNAIGANAMYSNSGVGTYAASYNNAYGYQALQYNTGSGNTAIGSYAFGNTATLTGSRNVALGYGVGQTGLTTGSSNILIGTSSLVTTPATSTSNYLNIGNAIKLNLTNVTATSSILNMGYQGIDDTSIGLGLGSFAAMTSTNRKNVAIGREAMATATGCYGCYDNSSNVAVGYRALYTSSKAYETVAIGYRAMSNNSVMGVYTSWDNTAIGTYAMMNNTGSGDWSSDYNVAIGYSALANNSSTGGNAGSNNTVLGAAALGSNSANGDYAGSNNSVIGANALKYNTGVGNYAASYNNVMGYRALYNNTGSGNTVIGSYAMSATTATYTGSFNVALGFGVGSTTLQSGSSNILIGTSSAVDVPLASTSNWLNIGNTIYGDLSTGSVAIGAAAVTAGTTLDLSGRTDSMIPPKGDDTTRPASPVAGMIRYSTTNNALEVYQGSTPAWVSLGASTGGSNYLGTAAATTAPSRSDDVTTGLFSDTASTVKVAISGTEKLAVTATGANLTQVTDGYAIAGVNMLHHVGADTTSVGIGPESLQTMTGTGVYNYAFGYQALQTNTANGDYAGSENNAIGLRALASNTASGRETGRNNNAIGTGAMQNNTANGDYAGSSNNAIGYDALFQNDIIGDFAGSGNNVLGVGAMFQNTANGNNSGSYNNVLGSDALSHNNASGLGSGSGNNAIGSNALGENTSNGDNSGSGNNAIGVDALSINTASGLYAGSGNNAIGYGALSSNAGNGVGEGSYNNAMGYLALALNEGKGNTVLGSYAMTRLDVEGNPSGPNYTGSYNVALGYGVGGSTLVSGSSNILIGTSSAVTTPAADTSNWLNIGNTLFGNLTTGSVAIGAVVSAITDGVTLDMSARTDSMIPPKGTEVQRPATPVAGMVRYNTDSAALEVYSGSSPAWKSISTLASCAGPDAFSFSNQTGVAVSSEITSDAQTLSGFACTASAVCSGCTILKNGVLQGTNANFVSGDTIAIRLTSSSGYGATATGSVYVGNTYSGAWSVTTTSDVCSGTPSIGTVCSDGTVYAGLSPDGNVKIYTTRCDVGQTWDGSACTGTRTNKKWSYGVTIATGYTNGSTGESNTSGLYALNANADGPYEAATFCQDLVINGQSDWYLPSSGELSVLYTSKTAIGNFDTSGTYYWSSSELNTTNAWIQRFSDGNQANDNKTGNYYVRCARR